MSASNYYKLPAIKGLEALDAVDYNTAFPAHFHPTFNISLIYEGVFEAKLNDKNVSATKGTIMITNPGEIHANPTTEGRTFFTFYLAPNFFEYADRLTDLQFKENVICDEVLFEGLHQIALKIKSGHIDSASEEILTKLLRGMALKHGSVNEVSETWKINALFENYLDESYFEKFSLQEAAKQLGLDKFKFLRLFKFQTGLTPNNYLILKKIEKSKIMLSQGSDLLSVAIDLGFYDTAHFCKHFKKFTGTSPVAYQSAV